MNTATQWIFDQVKRRTGATDDLVKSAIIYSCELVLSPNRCTRGMWYGEDIVLEAVDHITQLETRP